MIGKNEENQEKRGTMLWVIELHGRRWMRCSGHLKRRGDFPRVANALLQETPLDRTCDVLDVYTSTVKLQALK